MAIESHPSSDRSQAANGIPSGSLSTSFDPGCCQADDRHRSLVLTQLDGTTEGFPLTWLYRWQWRKESNCEVLTLTLTEHQVTIHGKHLDRITEHLRNNHGLHLQIKDERYFGMIGRDPIRISTITIQPHGQLRQNDLN
jgi:hypothetical protein